MPEPTLTREELASLDLIIADASTNRGVIQPQAGGARAAVWVAKQMVRRALQTIAERIVGGHPVATKLSDPEREALAKLLETEIGKEPTLEDLVTLRKTAKVRA